MEEGAGDRMTILLASTCREKLHELEFVKPIEKILKERKKQFFVRHYSSITRSDLQKAGKVIICGASLKDNEFMKHEGKFSWIKNYEKPVLGICAGMQIISLIFGAKLKRKTEIGFYMEDFAKSFLSLEGEHEVYHLHNNCTTIPKGFESFARSRIVQAIKHRNKEIYGVLFHPEVRNKKLIERFIE